MTISSNTHVSDHGEFPELERYELRERPRYYFAANRREFVQILGAGLTVAVSVEVARGQIGGLGRSNQRLTERFHLGNDGTVTAFTSKVEIGQGSRTQITQAIAEELRVPIEQIQLVMADTARVPDDGGTAGSRTTPSTVPAVRNAAAALRKLLTELAAEQLSIDRDDVEMVHGTFLDPATERNVTLAELVADEGFAERLATAAVQADEAIVPVEDWSVLGESVDKIGGHEVVTGAAEYPSDIAREGMLYGKVLRPPSYDAKLTAIDSSVAKEMEGVTVVQDGDFIGCTAANSWQAKQAIEALAKSAEWEEQSQVSHDDLFEHLKQTASAEGGGRRRGSRHGDVASVEASLERSLNATYTIAYIQHAPMETRAAVAEWEDGKLTAWLGTQQPARVHGQLRDAFRLGEDKVRVIVPDTGGGFGGKHTGEVAVEAARLAKAAGKPVSLHWTREEEFTWAYFRPAGVIEVAASLDDEGKLLAWDFTNINSGGSAVNTPYQVPHARNRFLSADSPLRQGSYRALASTANTFAREMAMDELAELAGVDPLTFRVNHLPEGRLRDVLQVAAEKFNWNPRRARPTAPNRGLGLACGTEKGSYVAACAEVEVVNNRIRVLSICQAYECGAIQNPSNLRAQVAGSILMGLGGALSEEILFRNGKILNGSFSQYEVPRMRDMPELDIVLVNRTDLPSVGGSETPIIAVAPAIANAVHQATGKWLRSLPMRLG